MEIDDAAQEIVAEMPPFFYLYKNGSVRRSSPHPLVPPSLQPIHGVSSKDVSLDSDLGQWARIFLPHPTRDKLPVVLYIHGGGFLFGSPSWSNFHSFCSDMARRSNSIWVSTSYRLAPEHRLPVAYDDCFAALQWILSQAERQVQAGALDPWLEKADFSRCFVAGESAGGNIVHHVAVRASREISSAALSIQGLILIHPGFLRESRTQAEKEFHGDKFANWKTVETCVQLALPPGSGADHPFLNPLSREAPELKDCKLPRMLVAVAERDVLYWTGLEYCEAMRKAGHSVEVLVSESKGHAFFIDEPECEQAKTLMERLTIFITIP